MSQEYTVFKKFAPQDYSITPFNAHKQYKFTSGSASAKKIRIYNTRYSSQSVDVYSSQSQDTFNSIKYYQIDHLYYRDFHFDLNNKFGDYHYLNQKRELYDKANIISIPVGLYGHSIKKGTFNLSASNYVTNQSFIIDDSNGNLIISGTKTDDYVTDCRSNILKIGPVKGFKKYDLNTVGSIPPHDKNGYLAHDFFSKPSGYSRNQKRNQETSVEDDVVGYLAYRRGKKRVKSLKSYTTPAFGDEYDDSYYHNLLLYKNVNFSEKDLFKHTIIFNGSSSYDNYSIDDNGNFQSVGDKFPTIDFHHSQIKINNDNKFNFNPEDDFLISFWFKNNNIGGGLKIGEYAVRSDRDGNKSYIIAKSKTTTRVPSPTEGRATLLNTNVTGALQEIDVDDTLRYPFEVYLDRDGSKDYLYFSRSDGNRTSTISASLDFQTGSLLMDHVSCRCSASQMEIFINGTGAGSSGSDATVEPTQNTSNVYIGNKGGKSNHFNGSLSQINIYDIAFSNTQIKNHYSSSNGSPYIGNIFYSHGMAIITHPGHQRILHQRVANFDDVGFNLNQLGFQGQIDSSEMNTAGSTDSTTQGGGDVFIKPDGTKAYVDGQDGQIAQFTLSTPYDISSASFEKHSPEFKFVEPTFTEISGDSHGITFNNDGSKVYIANARRRMITEISLTSSWDVGTFNTSKSINIASASYLNGDDVSGAQFNSLDIHFSMSRHPNNAFKNQTTTDVPGYPRFNTSGSKLYFKHRNRAVLYEVQLSGSFDIGSHKCFITGSGNTTFGLSGSSEADNRRETHILMKDLSKLASGSFKAGGTNIIAVTNDNPAGFDFNYDGTQLLAVNTENDSLNHYFLSSSFDINTIFPNLNNQSRFLPIAGELIQKGISTAEGLQGVRWLEVTGSTYHVSGSDSRVYIAIRDRDNRTGDNVYEYHVSKSRLHNTKFQGTHLIYEHEYQCSIDEYEYNDTLNITARKIRSSEEEDLADFATGSLFKPYVTTIGLYNEQNELLVVGKLGSPIRMSDETDTTFVVRWDV